MKWISSAFALVGLALNVCGVFLVSFRGFMGAKVNLFEFSLNLLFNTHYPMPARDGSPSPVFDVREWKGWRCMVWGFVLQALAVGLSLWPH